MIFFSFGATNLAIKRKHEFGIAHFPKFTQVNLIFVSLIILNKSQNRSLSELMRNYAFSNEDLDWHPLVRLARRKAVAKARFNVEKDYQERTERLNNELNEVKAKFRESDRENRLLRQTISGMELVGFREIIKSSEDDGVTPLVIVEASRP